MAGRRADAGDILLHPATLSASRPAPAVRAAGLDPAFSLYLDLVRIAAACAVVMAHFSYFRIFDDSQIARIADLGREAVIAFFVLSGFVIAYSAEQSNPTLRDYARARCARLYSVVLPVLVDYIVAMLVLANFACARHAGFSLLPHAKRLIRVLSAHTFTLYLSHSLVICCWQAFVPFERGAPGVLLGLALAVIAVAAALQPLTEGLQRRLRA